MATAGSLVVTALVLLARATSALVANALAPVEYSLATDACERSRISCVGATMATTVSMVATALVLLAGARGSLVANALKAVEHSLATDAGDKLCILSASL